MNRHDRLRLIRAENEVSRLREIAERENDMIMISLCPVTTMGSVLDEYLKQRPVELIER